MQGLVFRVVCWRLGEEALFSLGFTLTSTSGSGVSH